MPPNCWEYREIDRLDTPCEKTVLLQYEPDNRFSGIELQFLRGDFGMITYLNVYCQTILPSSLDPCASNVFIRIDDQDSFYLAHRMEGGQRLLLPEEAQEQLITNLWNGKEVTVLLDGYCTTYSPNYFRRLYKDFVSNEERWVKFWEL